MSKPDEPQNLTVRILTPSSRVYDGPAVSVSAVNKVGSFDILAGHANFFSLLIGPQVVVDTGVQKLEIPMEQGLLKVKNNMVTLFADIDSSRLA